MTTYIKGQWLKYPDHTPKHERYEYQAMRHDGQMETEGRFFEHEGVTQFFEPESITIPPPPEPETELQTALKELHMLWAEVDKNHTGQKASVSNITLYADIEELLKSHGIES